MNEFQTWLARLKELIHEDMCLWIGDDETQEPYDYVAQTGEEPWLDMYSDGMTPAEAWQAEKDAIAQDCE